MPTSLIHRIGIVLGRKIYRAVTTEEGIQVAKSQAPNAITEASDATNGVSDVTNEASNEANGT